MTVCHLLQRLEPSYLAASQCGREAEGAAFHCLNLCKKQSGREREGQIKKNSSHTRAEYKKKKHYLMMEADETPSWNVCQHADGESHLTLTPRGERGRGGNGLKLESFIETSMTEESCLRCERDCMATLCTLVENPGDRREGCTAAISRWNNESFAFHGCDRPARRQRRESSKFRVEEH